MTEPKQKRGKSVQDVGTPPEFILAVESKFGRLTFDLAASETNHVLAPRTLYYTKEDDALSKDWSLLSGNLWLNPEFREIRPWSFKSNWTLASWGLRHEESNRILMLTPAGVGTNWYAQDVHECARVYFLRPRLVFVGSKDPYPKDLMLSVFGLKPGFETWKWK